MGDVLSRSSDLAYWSEPRQVWSYGNWFRPDDLLTYEDATPAVIRHIHKRFSRYVRQHKAKRLCEKTPSNCLRIDFIRAVYPHAKIIFLLRDGRAVFRSTQEIQEKGVDWSRLRQRIAESSILDAPAYFSKLPWLFNKILRRPNRFWGVRPPGWKQWLKTDSPNVLLAKQWSESIVRAKQDFDRWPDAQKIKLRYEDIIKNPTDACFTLTQFLEISDPQNVTDYLLKTADSSRAFMWQTELENELLEEVKPYMEETLNQLGYDWDSDYAV